MPKVSVIVPVYCVEQYVARCAESLFMQTLQDMEFIFVDDCTKDDSIIILNKVLAQFPKRQKQTKIYQTAHNSGLSIVRKLGLSYACGDYIAFCDSDDYVDPTMYEQLYNSALKHSADIVVCDYFEWTGTTAKKKKGSFHFNNNAKVSSFLKSRKAWALWNKLFRASLFSENISFPQANNGEDLVLTIQLLHFSKKISFVKKSLYYWRQNNIASITKNNSLQATLDKYNQLHQNIELVFNNLEKWDEFDKKGIKEALLFHQNMLLTPLVLSKNAEKGYKEKFLSFRCKFILLSPYISLKDKLIYKYYFYFLRKLR